MKILIIAGPEAVYQFVQFWSRHVSFNCLFFLIKIKRTFLFSFFFLIFKNVMLSLEDVIEHLEQVIELLKNVNGNFCGCATL